MPSGIKPIRPLDAREGRGWPRPCASLAADRERLITRVATLEQSIDDITGSIARVEKAARRSPRRPQPRPAPSAAAGRSRQMTSPSSVSPPAAHRADAAASRQRQSPARPNSVSISAAPARSRRCAPPGPRRCAGTARCSKDLRPVVQMRERPPPSRSRIAPGRRPAAERRDGRPALRRDDGGGRDLRSRRCSTASGSPCAERFGIIAA